VASVHDERLDVRRDLFVVAVRYRHGPAEQGTEVTVVEKGSIT